MSKVMLNWKLRLKKKWKMQKMLINISNCLFQTFWKNIQSLFQRIWNYDFQKCLYESPFKYCSKLWGRHFTVFYLHFSFLFFGSNRCCLIQRSIHVLITSTCLKLINFLECPILRCGYLWYFLQFVRPKKIYIYKNCGFKCIRLCCRPFPCFSIRVQFWNSPNCRNIKSRDRMPIFAQDYWSFRLNLT